MSDWRKSSYSQGEAQGECIEVAGNTNDTTLIRDSKDPHGPHLTFTRTGFTKLVRTIKTGDDAT
ncbi:hypothetical protein GCM10023085_06190 [Actinomadura viridis]|uniref:DUF397 domain-containing protein n=1 Tax=Actinomadura viridis TaxID=58110 RepID=A0A931GLL4_9ACTN|nr:DUF397 domain-containing protein [Actinomadura viridis]MBG6091637.1 hypothetical protein [Actinomadura viridis]